MKKIALILISLLVALPLFSDPLDQIASWNGAFRPGYSSMGESGILQEKSENVYFNPSAVGNRFTLQLPSVSLRFHNIENNIPVFKGLMDGLMKGENIIPQAVGFLNNIPGGYKDFIELDGYAYLGFPYFALGTDFTFALLTFGDGDVTSQIASQVDASISADLSIPWHISDGWTLDFGLGVKAKYKLASMNENGPDGIGVKNVADVLETTLEGVDIPGAINDLLKKKTNYSSGWALPISAALTVRMPYGFSLGLVANNINGSYDMVRYNTMDEAYEDEWKGDATLEKKPFTLTVPMNLILSTSWEMENFLSPYWLRTSVSLDFVDIVGFWRDVDKLSWPLVVEHVKMGAEVALLTAFEARVGLDRGFFTCGAAIDLWGNRLEFTYGVKPYREIIYGDSLDYVAVTFTLGWEKY